MSPLRDYCVTLTGRSLKVVINEAVFLTLGALVFFAYLVLAILSIPVYLFRGLVILLAKWTRPDLEMLNFRSSFMARDLFSKRPPRANIVLTAKLKDSDEFNEKFYKERLINNLIEAVDVETGLLKYPKLQQYPTKWLGFVFWKKCRKFDLNNHLFFHENLSGSGSTVRKEELVEFTEKLLNASHLPYTSPWEFHFVKNYEDESNPSERIIVFFIKVHHSLADGFGILHTIPGSFLGHSISDESIPLPRANKRSVYKQVQYWLGLPFSVFYEMSCHFTYLFRPSLWRTQNEKKVCYQLCFKSDLIPIQRIKDIKNSLGVSFTSVLFSAISAGLHKTFEEKKKRNQFKREDDPGRITCGCSLPLPGHSKQLTNHWNFTLFDMPTIHFPNPLDRLYNLEETLEKAKGSGVPFYFRIGTAAVGAHFSRVCAWFTSKPFMSTGLSNFPCQPIVLQVGQPEIKELDFVLGNMGIAETTVGILSYNQNIVITITADKCLMRKEELATFIGHVSNELLLLEDIAAGKK